MSVKNQACTRASYHPHCVASSPRASRCIAVKHARLKYLLRAGGTTRDSNAAASSRGGREHLSALFDARAADALHSLSHCTHLLRGEGISRLSFAYHL